MKRPVLVYLVLFLPALVLAQRQDSLVLKIGQMIMMGFSGTSVDTTGSFYKDIRDGKTGGISIYEPNLRATHTGANLRALIDTLQAASPIQLFTAITQEGGLVNRLKTKYGFPPLPSAEYLGKLDNVDSTRFYAEQTATLLYSLGINVNFAPVLDVYKADNPVLGSRQRTYSANTAVIVRHARQVVLAHDRHHVITALKHFPGHGSSTADSHLGLTDVSATWRKDELKPYRQLMKEGLARSVMTAHIVNFRLDMHGYPATLSHSVITSMLREKLGFNGVVFSDDMNMKAISAEYGMKESIERAINAGVDVLLFSGRRDGASYGDAADIVTLILQLVKEGRVTPERINQSYRRIMQLKRMVNPSSPN